MCNAGVVVSSRSFFWAAGLLSRPVPDLTRPASYFTRPGPLPCPIVSYPSSAVSCAPLSPWLGVQRMGLQEIISCTAQQPKPSGPPSPLLLVSWFPTHTLTAKPRSPCASDPISFHPPLPFPSHDCLRSGLSTAALLPALPCDSRLI